MGSGHSTVYEDTGVVNMGGEGVLIVVLEPRVEAGESLVGKVIATLFTLKRHLRGPRYRSSIIMVFPSYGGLVRVASRPNVNQ